jgi:hypothetical protein
VCRSWSPSATEIALPASVTAEPRVGSCGDERLAAGLADNLIMVDAATLPGTGVEDNRPKPKPPKPPQKDLGHGPGRSLAASDLEDPGAHQSGG